MQDEIAVAPVQFESLYVPVDELRLGMFVILELSWLAHPFPFNSFVVRTEQQLATIRSLSLARVRIDPRRSVELNGAAPTLTEAGATPAGVETAPRNEPGTSPAAAKALRVEQNRALRVSIGAAERKATQAATVLRDVAKRIFSEPQRAAASADALVTDVAAALLGNSEVMIHLLNDRVAGEEGYFHSLNVTMLALLLGKAVGLDPPALKMLGIAAVFHDIGKEEIPYRILAKTEPLTKAEAQFVREHCAIGARMAAQAGLPEQAVVAILQHHEQLDGSGYPRGLVDEQISPLARLICVANAYDNLCNPVNPAVAHTPYEALSVMFARRKGCFDQQYLGKLVHLLGVYPPGSIVSLSTGATAMVISVNPARPLQPMLIVHDAAIPREEAIILELEKHPDISITKAVRPSNLSRAVYEYLSPRKRMTYYFDARG